MPGSLNPKDFTEEEIRQTLGEKLRRKRSGRLERFQRTGRAIVLVPNSDQFLLQDISSMIVEDRLGAAYTLRRLGNSLGKTILISMELVAALVFLVILFGGMRLMGKLNREAISSWSLIEITPTPLIQPVELPSGHIHLISPDEKLSSQYAIPNHLRPELNSQFNIPVPTLAPAGGIRIQIPAIGVDAPIVHGDGWEQLRKGVAHRSGTADPGQNGNIVLSGHNDVYGEVFRHLDQLTPGDKIILFTNQRSYSYIVTALELVEPTQVDVMDPTPDKTLTLISCYPYLVDTQRIIIKGKLANS